MKVMKFNLLLAGGLLMGMLFDSFSAQAQAQVQAPFPVTPELLDSLNSPDATWPKDPAVPDLPPLPNTDDLPPPKDNFLKMHYWDGIHRPAATAPPTRSRMEAVNESNTTQGRCYLVDAQSLQLPGATEARLAEFQLQR